ncbi:uncharacterized protein A4U43_C02F19010 [Asparagus officinalis]|uniref:Uncharacterized protein n=1 Tax=Asparagus officinalis TaxID=4686 RepID=A0A5P1FJB0_ASPOF|nr:uncharacterized protein A4U43_C02F18440 [Asparagus officinalis]ONK78460.1 uncharacterized protein A4U43_C02F19010 [Asparagus officinalis]
MKREFEMMKRRSCNESSGALLESRIDEKTLQIKNLLEDRNDNASKRLFDMLRLMKLMDPPAEAKNATNYHRYEKKRH